MSRSLHSYEQSIQAMQANPRAYAKFDEFVQKQASKRTLSHFFDGPKMVKRGPLNQRQNRKNWRQNPSSRPKSNKR